MSQVTGDAAQDQRPPCTVGGVWTQERQALSLSARSVKDGMLHHLEFTLAELPGHVDSVWVPYEALALAVRDRLFERWVKTQESYYASDAKRVYYLSMEFLMGRTLGNALINLGFYRDAAKAAHELGYDLEELREAEWDAGLGNGGLGRLAACFMDSLATMGIPAHGYGIRYDYGIFHQRIVNDEQVETPDAWLRYGNPWEVARPIDRFTVQFHGRVHQYMNEQGKLINDWVDAEEVYAIPYDTPIPGYGNDVVNTLRLWGAKATDEFDFRHFNQGDYQGAVIAKDQSENITKVLYPNDNFFEGKELRLKQEYFLVAATLHDIVRRYKKQYRMVDEKLGLKTFEHFSQKVCIQLNDTHPSLAIPELMRILVDLEGLEWDEAWAITTSAFAYTNHTILPEAMERWPVDLLGQVLPRHLQIIYEINARFLALVRARYSNDDQRCRRMSIIEESEEKRVRMAVLAIVGSHSVNGVAALHTDILRNDIFREYAELWPEKFNNKTNGVTQRRWLLKSNPSLSALINDSIGDRWVRNLYELKKLTPLAANAEFRAKWQAIRLANKQRLAEVIRRQYEKRGIELRIEPASLFDVQVKRIHEYKRQLLNALHVITLYNRIKDNPNGDHLPRTVIFGGKAAPGYYIAKLIIRLINAIGDTVNADKDVGDKLKVVFLADYRVSLAERIFPAADLSEQISTAGTEASGTGNMKFTLNGGMTIGTMDGANIEIRQEVGDDNIFIFGLTAEQARLLQGRYNPWNYYNGNPQLQRTLDMIKSGYFNKGAPGLFQPIFNSLLHGGDRYLLLADYASYVDAQDRVAAVYRQPDLWTRMSIMNTANCGKFSSDRTIAEYAKEIWEL